MALTAAGQPELAELGDEMSSCVETAPWLRVPVDMSIVLAGGDVLASGTTILDVGALELERVHLYTTRSLPAQLSGDYATQVDGAVSEFAGSYPPGSVRMGGTWLVLSRTWAEPLIDIDVGVSLPEGAGSIIPWRGTWTLP